MPSRSQSPEAPEEARQPFSSGPRPWPPADEHLTPFLPMVYVAWSDGVLTDSEMGRIREEIGSVEGLSPQALGVLESWLRPESPPSPGALAGLRGVIEAVATEISPEERRSLASLGIALARSREGGAERWATERGMRVLEGIEEVLGVLGGEAAREITRGGTLPAAPAPETLAFPVERLAAYLEGDRSEIRARVLELLADPVVRVPDGLPTAEARDRVLEALRRLAKEGMGGLAFPSEYGGKGDVLGSLVAFETLGYGNLSVLIKYGVQFGLFGGSIAQLGTSDHHRRYLGRVATLDLPGIYGMTEKDHGSNVRDIETTARYLPESQEFEVRTPHAGAAKDWLGNAALHGRMATVFAQLEVKEERHGVHAFLVPVRDDEGRPMPGVTIEDRGEKVGLNGIDNGCLSFDRVRVPRENLLNRFGDVTPEGEYRSEIASPGRRFFTMLGTLVAGRISIAAGSISATKTGLAVAIRYSDRRRQFGPSGEPEVPVLDYLLHQRALIPALAATYALHFAVRDLFQSYATLEEGRLSSKEDPHEESGEAGGGPPQGEEELRRLEILAAGLKAYASRHAQETLQSCREALGGRGYLAANRLGYLREDTDVFTTFEGANPVLLQLVAKGLLTEYRNELGDLRLWGIVRHLGDLAGAQAQRLNPVRSRRTGEDFLRDPEIQMEALAFRENRLRETAARRLKSRIDDGMDSFRALNECQDHLVSLARAHVERVVLESFRFAVEEGTDLAGAEAGKALELLADLYALSRIERDRAWFLETGYMEGGQSKAIRTLVNSLCREIRPLAVPLVDAFGIPEDLLGAPDAIG